MDQTIIQQGEAENKDILVLIVEDDKFMRGLLANRLKKENFTVETAATGEEALEKILKRKPNLILLDLILPAMDGFEVIKKLKIDKNFSDIPVLIISNLSEKEDQEKATYLGVEGFLVKAEYTPSQIIKEVKNLINKKYL